VLADDLVGNGGPGARQLDHGPLRRFDRLPHRLGYFVGLAGGDTDLALAIAHGHQGVEREPPSALHHLGYPVDRDHVLHVLAGAVPISPIAAGTAAATPVASLATPAASPARTIGSGRPLSDRGPIGRLAGLCGAAFGNQAVVLRAYSLFHH
jgi:hypothetical protein